MKEKKLVKDIFSMFGEEIELKNEDSINAITALSGSGPAYFFYICELLTEQACAFGFSKRCRKIAANTLLGAAELVRNKRNFLRIETSRNFKKRHNRGRIELFYKE